jgi:hypothetical protein
MGAALDPIAALGATDAAQAKRSSLDHSRRE